MKRLYALLFCAVALLGGAPRVFAQCTADPTLIVGPADQYAFQWCNGTSVTNVGLMFAPSANQFQFKGSTGNVILGINPIAQQIWLGDNSTNYAKFDGDGDLEFIGTGDFLVPNNRYAFRAKADEDYGLYFNANALRYEFRNSTAAARWYVEANSGNMWTFGGVTMGNSTLTTPGTMRWTGTDFQGYDGSTWQSLTSGGAAGDADWTIGSGIIYNTADFVGIGTTAPAVKLNVVETSSLQPAAAKFDGVLAPTRAYLGVQGQADFDGIIGLNIPGNEIGVLGLSTGGTATDNYGVFGYSNGFGVRALHSVSGNEVYLGTPTHAMTTTGDVLIDGSFFAEGPGNSSSTTDGPYNFGPVTGTHLTFDNNEIQAKNGAAGFGTLFINYYGGNVDIASTIGGDRNVNIHGSTLVVNGTNDFVGIGTSAPSAKLDVIGTAEINGLLDVNNTVGRSLDVVYSGTTSTGQIANIQTTFDMASGNDLLQLVAPSTSSIGAAFIEAEAGGIKFQVNLDGHAGFGTTASSTYAIQACGSIRAKELVVETGWCDYVFEEDYDLMPIGEVAAYIAENKHLPGIPEGSQVESEGLAVGEMSANLMRKIEELTLYVIDANEQIEELRAENEALMNRLENLER